MEDINGSRRELNMRIQNRKVTNEQKRGNDNGEDDEHDSQGSLINDIL